jgi:hypothetical protein
MVMDSRLRRNGHRIPSPKYLLFIGIHDAKFDREEYNWPRVSLVRLPKSELEGVTWQSLDLKFLRPEGRKSDLESASSIPSSKAFLFAESGQEAEDAPRIS